MQLLLIKRSSLCSGITSCCYTRYFSLPITAKKLCISSSKMSARFFRWETKPMDSNGLLIVTKNNCCHLFIQLERIAFEVTRIMFVENLRCAGPGNICYSSILVVYT